MHARSEIFSIDYNVIDKNKQNTKKFMLISAARRPRSGGAHVVVLNNLREDASIENARFLPQLLDHLSAMRCGSTVRLVRRVSVVRSPSALNRILKCEDGVDRVIMGGSSTQIWQLSPTDPRRVTSDRIITLALREHVPVLGICFGAQLIVDAFGGTLRPMDDIMCRTRRVRWCGRQQSTTAAPKNDESGTTRKATGSISTYMFCLKYLPSRLDADAKAPPESRRLIERARLLAGKRSGAPVAFSHVVAPLHGVLFHPESELSGTSGAELLRHFVQHGELAE